MARYSSHEFYQLRILEKYEELVEVEKLQSLIWPSDDIDIIPAHLLLAAAHNGGIVIGAYNIIDPTQAQSSTEIVYGLLDDLPANARLVGFVFSFPGLYTTPDGPRLKHHSHMLGVLPEMRNKGVGFLLKRAQWQLVRHQEIDRITWTFDPLLGHNAYLNISRLGAVCNTYLRDAYGSMRDALNAGLPSDRFQVDWWVNSPRVARRLSKKPRLELDLAHFLAAGVGIVNPSQIREDGFPQPFDQFHSEALMQDVDNPSLVLVEIPPDFQQLRAADLTLALEWRLQTRLIFEGLFSGGYLVTDFIHLPGITRRSFYVLSHGESTL